MENHPPTYQLSENFDNKLNKFVEKFLQTGFETFKEEFKQIDSFVEQALSDNSERNDHSLRRSEKEKYLLELISFKIYDQLNREKFNQCEKTIIIMPDCLSIHDYDCLKTDEDYGDACQSCHPDCQAFQITELEKKYDVLVLFSKRKLSDQLKYQAKQLGGDTSVIGVACIMMLADGMRTAHEIGIPARGVLLNYTGCDHWNDNPFASEFCVDSLKNILEEKYER